MNYTGRNALAALALTMTAAAPLHAQGADYILATASTGGTYYPVGVALATLIKVKLQPSQGIGMSAISSAGSGENIRLLREGEARQLQRRVGCRQARALRATRATWSPMHSGLLARSTRTR
mgnify:CR=1 FL=1